MNYKKLKSLELNFLAIHKEGFDSYEMKQIGKKHNVTKVEKFVKDVCSKENLLENCNAIDDIVKIVTKSSMVSVFEKMKFRDLVKELNQIERQLIVEAIYENIHKDEEKGFKDLYNLLEPYKLAKWPLITVFRAYYNLNYDVFIKPTTVKKVIKYLELDDLLYNSKPSYDFYDKYRTYINEMKMKVSETLRPNNPAFSGFLMININWNL